MPLSGAGPVSTGKLLAHTESEAMHLLREQGLRAIALYAPDRPSDNPQSQQIRGFRANRITSEQSVLVIRELATLLRAGITLIDSVQSLAASREGTAMGVALTRTAKSLTGGSTFLTALEASRIPLPSYVGQLAQTGEMTGKLASCLSDAAKQLEYEARIRKELMNALIYPCTLIAAGFAAVMIILFFVIPRFAPLVRGSRGAQVPEISMWVINSGVFFKANWGWFAIGFTGAAILLALSLRDSSSRLNWLKRLAHLPLVGPALLQAELGRWATMLGTLLQNKVPILKALDLAATGLRFPDQRRSMDLVSREVQGGATLADTLKKYRALDPTGLNLVRVGEQAGELAQMTTMLGEMISDAGRNRMKRILTLIEPLAIVIIAGAIGFLMAAVMMAITSISPGG